MTKPEDMTNEELLDDFETRGQRPFGGSYSPDWKEYATVRAELLRRLSGQPGSGASQGACPKCRIAEIIVDTITGSFIGLECESSECDWNRLIKFDEGLPLKELAEFFSSGSGAQGPRPVCPKCKGEGFFIECDRCEFEERMTSTEVAQFFAPSQVPDLSRMLGEALGTVKTMQATLEQIRDTCKDYADAPTLTQSTGIGTARKAQELAEAELARPISPAPGVLVDVERAAESIAQMVDIWFQKMNLPTSNKQGRDIFKQAISDLIEGATTQGTPEGAK